MRTRNKGESKVVGYSWSSKYYPSVGANPLYTLTDAGVKTVFSNQESMNDNGHGKGRFNPCLHVAYRGNAASQAFHYYLPGGGGTSYYETFFNGPCGLYSLGAAQAALPSSLVGTPDYQQRVYAMFKDMTSAVPITVSVPNFLFELREIKDLIPKWEGLLKSISGGFLTWQFGWKPFLADIKNILSSVKDARKRIAELKKLNHKSTVLHRTYSVDLSGDVLQPGKRASDVPPFFEATFGSPLTRVSACKCTVTITLDVFYDLSGLDSQDAFLKTMLTQLGFMNAPKVIWEAIPFSWLLEYFVNITRVLDSFDNNPFEGSIRVREAATTIKMAATVEVGGYFPTINDVISNNYVSFTPVSTYFVERYDRRLGLDIGADIYLKDSLSASQLAIIAALLHQRS